MSYRAICINATELYGKQKVFMKEPSVLSYQTCHPLQLQQARKFYILWFCTQTWPRCYLHSKCRMFLQYKRKCTLIYTCKKSMALFMPIFTKPKNAQEYYVQISYAKFHLNQTINMESKGRNSCMPLRKLRLSLSQFPTNPQSLNKLL